MLGDQKIHLAIADPMFARAGPLHRERAIDHSLVEPVRFGQLLRAIRVEHKDEVKITIPDVPHQSIGYWRLREISLGFANAFCKP